MNDFWGALVCGCQTTAEAATYEAPDWGLWDCPEHGLQPLLAVSNKEIPAIWITVYRLRRGGWVANNAIAEFLQARANA